MLPEKYKALCRLHLDNLWRAWRGLGMFSEGPFFTMGLEEALCGLCVFGRYDQRLFDEAVSLILAHPGLVNKNKIAGLLQKADPDTTTVHSVITHLLASSGNRSRVLPEQKTKTSPLSGAKNEPFFLSTDGNPDFTGKAIDPVFTHLGWQRNVFHRSDTVPQLSTMAAINPWIRAKLVYGNSVRADVVLHLLAGSATAPDIARKSGFTQKSVWNVLDDFLAAGLVTSTPAQNRLVYSLTKNGTAQFSLVQPGKKAVSLWQEWKTAGHYLFHLKKLPDDASPRLIESEVKRIEKLIR
jgi:hypothetical protein